MCISLSLSFYTYKFYLFADRTGLGRVDRRDEPVRLNQILGNKGIVANRYVTYSEFSSHSQ